MVIERGTLGLLLLAGLSACGSPASETVSGTQAGATEAAADAETIPVSLADVRREPVSSLYVTSTTVRPEKQATVTARTRGVIRRLHVEEGVLVVEGQELALLEDDEQRIEQVRARSIRDTKARELARAAELHARGLLSDETYEVTRREASEAEQAAALAELNLSRTVIRAPFAGRVLRRHLDPGSTVADGTPVYDVADVEPLHADVNVPERHLALLTVGQPVRVLPGTGAVAAEARIERLAPAVDTTTGTVKVTLAIAQANGLRPGAFVRVEIVTDTHDAALVVPRSALVAEGRRWHLFRLDPGQDKVVKVDVALGYEEGDRVEVLGLDDGALDLAPGVRVVSAGASALTDGARVRVVETPSEESPADVAA
jgi:membrane fusion protein (multidrug efflux system)